MADRLASIHGTELDRLVNCPFYFKVGACRHGDRCSRQHNKPLFSQTVLLSHMYQAPASAQMMSGPTAMATAADDKASQDHFDEFYEEVYEELEKFGKIEELNVCANLGDHMIGNVYVKYEEEEQAEKALNALNGRFYAGRLIMAEYSPVTDFRESRCRQYEETQCKYGGHCNFMHIKRPSKEPVMTFVAGRYDDRRRDDRGRPEERRERERSRSGR
ncbi:hypothetical protein GUITHDRAFT_78757 [Guillardia theta CCMP2712]|uniref:Uncharacterized protein n=1 Tax=Guillardia theta (strain CCMP2712) TaxID=905079 RepID=L1IK86_GUITC|nr:hypothetical protein GUITHDRAFT_78757 [Guillardia theta CCMP2712]EKX36656.1 hypothetical protein GUITHDRAFT_78757 [Guillardia theta CCMP2712]|eukprot:XP_005823636.1 hypothetical protein GUITHDRAFT_78757 [Guillardia theta CCMP2712]